MKNIAPIFEKSAYFTFFLFVYALHFPPPHITVVKSADSRTSLAVQWLKTLPSNAGSTGSIPGWGAKIPHALWPKNQNIKRKQCCNKFNKDFKNSPH